MFFCHALTYFVQKPWYTKACLKTIRKSREEAEGVKTYLYVDVYFILNFIMNLFLIMLTAMLRQKRCRIRHFLLLSAAGGILSVIVTYIFWGKILLQMIISLLQMVLLVLFAFERTTPGTFLRDYLTFFFLTFFTGGLTGAVQNFLWKFCASQKAYSVSFLFFAVFLMFLVFLIFRFEFIREEHARISIREAMVVHFEVKVRIKLLHDTGNRLISPYTGEAVAVISKELAHQLGIEGMQTPVLIPYHSIGGDGLLNAYRIEYLLVEGRICKKNFLAAVSENLTKEQGVQMILNIT